MMEIEKTDTLTPGLTLAIFCSVLLTVEFDCFLTLLVLLVPLLNTLVNVQVI